MNMLLANIDVDDLDKAIDFYSEAFGLRLGRRFSDVAAEMLGASSPIYLLAKPPGSSVSVGTSQQRTYQRHWTPVHLDFVVGEIQEGFITLNPPVLSSKRKSRHTIGGTSPTWPTLSAMVSA